MIKCHAIKTYVRVEVKLYAFLNSGLDGSEWSASRNVCYIPREVAPYEFWRGDCKGPSDLLVAVAKRKIPALWGIDPH
jgi:hypothetical protein